MYKGGGQGTSGLIDAEVAEYSDGPKRALLRPEATPTKEPNSLADPAGELLAAHAEVSAHQRDLLDVVARCEAAEVWVKDGCRDLAEWLACHIGISQWAARRWVNAAAALPNLPELSRALEAGTLCLDKILELCRFVTPETEHKLITWARRVTVATMRRRADVANRPDLDDVKDAHKTRYLRYWWELDGTRLGVEGSWPADQGAVIATALDRLASRMPDVTDADGDREWTFEDVLDVRRADALVAMASRAVAEDTDADRATVVVHTQLDALVGDGGCELEHGPVLHAETVRRLACDCRLEAVIEDDDGRIVGVGPAARTVSPKVMRQLRYRDRCCTFPGCGRRWYLHAHHIKHWIWGGPTEPDNLILLCVFHHKLVHELGWIVKLGEPGTAEWFRPNGRRFDPGSAFERAPPLEPAAA